MSFLGFCVLFLHLAWWFRYLAEEDERKKTEIENRFPGPTTCSKCGAFVAEEDRSSDWGNSRFRMLLCRTHQLHHQKELERACVKPGYHGKVRAGRSNELRADLAEAFSDYDDAVDPGRSFPEPDAFF